MVGQHPLAGRPRRRRGERPAGPTPRHRHRARARAGSSMLVVRLVLVGRLVGARRVLGNGGRGTGEAASAGASAPRSGRDHERLAPPQRGGRAPDGPWRPSAQRPADRGQRHAGRHQDGHEDDGDEQDGGAGRAEAGVERAADDRAEVAAGVRSACESRTAARPWPARPGRRCRAGRAPMPTARRQGSAPSCSSSSSSSPAAIEQQGAGRRRRPPAGAGRGPSRRAAPGRCRRRGRRGRAAGPTGPGPGGRRA